MFKALIRIWKEDKYAISYIYFLNILEELCYLLIPSTVGMMIDSFFYVKGYGLLAFTLCYVGWQLVALIRRIQDTKIFTEIFNKLSLNILNKKNEELTTTLISARIGLMNEIVTFFEDDLPFFIRSLISIFGSALLLYYYNPLLLLVSLIIIIPSLIINYYYSSRLNDASYKLNSHYEKQVEIIEKDNKEDQIKYFTELRKYKIRKSNLEAFNFTIIEMFVFVMITVSIYVICKSSNMNYGSIVASYGIILRFAYGFDILPHITSRYATLQDVVKRMEVEK
jgi:ABC-type bacteriocin/lantibiotic exporter with double-glycine peptidase domain